MWCQSAIRQKGIVAENFPTIINLAIAVQIKRQNTIIFIHPTGLFGKTALVVIKITPRSDTCSFDTVTIQIEDDGTIGIFGIFQTRILVIFARKATILWSMIFRYHIQNIIHKPKSGKYYAKWRKASKRTQYRSYTRDNVSRI